MPLLGVVFTILGLICLIIAFFSVSHETEFYKSSNISVLKKKKIGDKFKHMFIPINNAPFVKYLGIILFASIAGSILGKTINPFLLNVIRPNLPIEIQGIELVIYPVISVIFKFVWLYIWIYFFKKLNLKAKFLWNFVTLIVSSAMILIFLIDIIFPDLFSYILNLILLIISVGSILGGMYSRRYFQSPFLAAIIDEAAPEINGNKMNGVSNIAGAFYGLNSFFMNIGSAVANLLIGFILTGNNRDDPIILTLLFSSMSIFYFISWVFLKFVKLKQEI